MIYAREKTISEAVIEVAVSIIEAELCKPSKLDIVIPIMNGGLFFAADLLRQLYPEINPIVAAVKMTRYPRLTRAGEFFAAGQSEWHRTIPGTVHGKHILLVDGVYDTGATIEAAKKMLAHHEPASVQSAVLVWKNLKDIKTKPDYWGIDCQGEDHFLYGYGMDLDGRQRGNPRIEY